MSRTKLKENHRKIMLLNHPDRGGSPYLASKINGMNSCKKKYIEKYKKSKTKY